MNGADDRAREFDSRKHFLALLAGRLGGLRGPRPLTATLAPNSGAARLSGGKTPARSTLGEANRSRPAEFFVAPPHRPIARARVVRRELRAAVRPIDAPPLDLGPRMKRWFAMSRGGEAARRRGGEAAKIHVVYDPATQRPVYFELTDARASVRPARDPRTARSVCASAGGTAGSVAAPDRRQVTCRAAVARVGP